LATVRAEELGALVLREAVARAKINPVLIEDAIYGCQQNLREQGGNIARKIVLAAGFPETVPGVTVHRICSSGQSALHFAIYAIASGEMDVVVAGGVEHCTRIGFDQDVPQEPSPWILQRFKMTRQGVAADNVAAHYGISREDLDAFGYMSNRRAAAASQEGRFKREIVPIEAKLPDGASRIVDTDEAIRYDTSVEKMAALKPAFSPEGKHTAGTSSQITDGSAALVLASRRKARELGLKPLARIVT